MPDTIEIAALYAAAKGLIDTDRVCEYTRGICELIAEVDGKPDIPLDVRSKEVALQLGVAQEIADRTF
jgi:hypothetical protein